MAKVYFIGAGSGVPELITMKGRRLLDATGVTLKYAGPALKASEEVEGKKIKTL